MQGMLSEGLAVQGAAVGERVFLDQGSLVAAYSEWLKPRVARGAESVDDQAFHGAPDRLDDIIDSNSMQVLGSQ